MTSRSHRSNRDKYNIYIYIYMFYKCPCTVLCTALITTVALLIILLRTIFMKIKGIQIKLSIKGSNTRDILWYRYLQYERCLAHINKYTTSDSIPHDIYEKSNETKRFPYDRLIWYIYLCMCTHGSNILM